MTVELSLGCKRYPWIEPLQDGTVEPTGIDLTVVDGHLSPDYYTRLLDDREFDLAELSIGAYFATFYNADQYDVTALPVFPHRRFRHSLVYTREGSAIQTPTDLEGAAVGVPMWLDGIAIWMRGILQERYGLDLRSVDWRTFGSEVVPMDISDEFDISHVSNTERDDAATRIKTGTIATLERKLTSGELDAAITPVEFSGDEIERLFDDAWAREREYYTETGIFPIMHLVAIRDEVLEAHPWVAEELYEAFVAAGDRYQERIEQREGFKFSPYVWGQQFIEEQLSMFDGNPWSHGLTEGNRKTMRKAVEYAADHDVAPRELDLDDLFLDVGPNWAPE